MKLKGGHVILGLVAILFVLMVTFSPTVQSYIPPTPAWFRITSGGLNVTAQNSSGVVNFIAGTNITITPNYATNSITFSSSSGVGDTGNIWDINCPAGEFFNTFSNSTHPNFGCATPAGGSADYTNIAYTNETNTFILPQNINHTLNLENPDANVLGEIVGEINFTGRNDNNDPIQYSRIYTELADPTAGAEAGTVHFQAQDYNGILQDFITWDDTTPSNYGLRINSTYVTVTNPNGFDGGIDFFDGVIGGNPTLRFHAKNDNGDQIEISELDQELYDSTPLSEKSKLRIRAGGSSFSQILIDSDAGIQIVDTTSKKLAFHGATPTTQQAVTGDRYGNTALADFLTDMDAKGLIDDQTTDSGLPSGSTLDTMQNIGTGEGSVYAGNTTNTNFTFKTIKAGSNISIANNTNDITISATDTGEVNTASNFGTYGTGIFKDKSGVDLRFLKALSLNSNLIISSNSSNILFNVTGTASGADGSNIGTGEASVYAGNADADTLNFKTLKQARGITLTNNTNDVTIGTSFFANSKTCSGNDRFTAYDNTTGVYTCTTDPGLTAAITSINADTTTAQVFSGTSGNVTITDTGAGTLQWNLGPDVVMEGGTQTITGSKTMNDLTLGGTLNANNNILDNVQYLASNADEADTGTIRLGNAETIAWEASPAGTDSTITQDSSENLVLSSGWNNVDLGLNPMINSIFDVAGTGNRLTSTGIVLGDLLKSDGTDFKRFAKGTAYQHLRTNSGATDIEWYSPPESLAAEWPVDRTWTNIGTSYVNVYNTGLGDPIRIDTNGMTKVSFVMDWTKVGAGTQNCMIVNQASPTSFLIIINNVATGLNTNATQTIPAAFTNTIVNVIPVCKSTTGADDPVWLTGSITLKP